MYINTSSNSGERLCNVVVSEPSAHSPEALRMSVVLSDSVDMLRLEKLLRVPELHMLRPVLKSDQLIQCAKMGPESDADMEALESLAKYMTARELVSNAPIYSILSVIKCIVADDIP